MRQLPSLGAALEIRCRELPEIDGGWATIAPVPALPSVKTAGLISEHCDASYAALVLGQLQLAGEPAEHALEAFLRGGAERVAQLDGVFSALIVERRQARVHVVTSVLGARPLRYRCHAGALALAPTDLGVVALSQLRPDVDLGALATLVACGWPLGGGTGLRGVEECEPRRVLTWARGRIAHTGVEALLQRPRLAARDVERTEAKLDEVLTELEDGTRRELERHPAAPVNVPLTAGTDSRAVLALLLHLAGRERVRTYTRGTSSQDARVARELARRLGLGHETLASEPPSRDDFLCNARFLAAATNGIANAHVAARPKLHLEQEPPVPLGGGGEVFRGYYYKYLWRQGALRGGPKDVVRALLVKPFERLHQTRFATPALEAEPAQRFRAAVHSLATLSRDAADLADLFFFFESMGRWGSTLWRQCLGRMFMPLANHRAFAAALELPPPIGDHAILARLIARHAPRGAYWTPLNGAGLLCLEGGGPALRVTREALRIGAKLVREARQRVWPEERGPKHVRLAYLRGVSSEVIRDTLRSGRSLARQLFTPAQLEALLDPRDTTPGHFTLAGAVFSLDLWREALDGASAPSMSLRPTPEPALELRAPAETPYALVARAHSASSL